MPHTIGPLIAASAQAGVGYAERLFKEIPDDKFGAFARTAEGTIESNHPAFVCGHLCLYSPHIIEQLGQDASSIKAPESYEGLFSDKVTCQDDPDGTTYPAAGEIKSQLITGYSRVAEVVAETDDSLFMAENPFEGLRERFPTKGAMHAFLVGGHFMMHMGQLSAWRRAIGLSPA